MIKFYRDVLGFEIKEAENYGKEVLGLLETLNYNINLLNKNIEIQTQVLATVFLY